MDAVPIRAHNLLCLLGYRGKGYDQAFIERMTDVSRTLAADPGTPVQVLIRPDRLCDACPHLRTDGCSLGGPRHEAHMRAQDLDVARRLGLEEARCCPGARSRPGRAARPRVRPPDDLHDLPVARPRWCAEGIERTRADRTETAPP
jgi:hypothetical protein